MNAPLSARLAKLIPMLSSDRDGEVLAAVRAIGLTLKSEHQDFHWLAGRLSELDWKKPLA